MIIFLHGADSYRSKQKLEEITDKYKETHKSGLNVIRIDAQASPFSDCYDALRVSSMFSEKKLVVVKNMFSEKAFQDDFSERLDELERLPDVIVVHENDVVDKRLSLFKRLVKHCKNQEFELLDTKGVKIWIKKLCEQRKATINSNALELLASCVGNDLWLASNEIQKLADFKRGSVIKKEDVELQVRPRVENDIFKTIDALAAKNTQQALVLLQKHLDAGENPLYLLSMVAYQFRNLLVVKEMAQKGLMYNSIIKKSGLHPFVVKKSYFACRQFSFSELKDTYRKIYQIDFAIKTGKVEPETALHVLVSQLSDTNSNKPIV